jgi:methionyl-tRNA formyltransferase
VLDWNWTAARLWRKVRACNPWPGSYINWMDMRIKIMETIPLSAVAEGDEGQVIELPRGSVARVAVRTGDGLLGLLRIQPEGKREMTASDFTAGHRDFIGSIL